MTGATRRSTVWTIVVAAGEGRRYGGPKQYEILDGLTVLAHSVALARHVSAGVVAVVPSSRVGDADAGGGADMAVSGGETRSDSVRAGIAALPDDVDIVLVHDAARPLASPELFASVVAAIEDGADGVVPGLPLTDTVKQVDGGVVIGTLDRAALVTVQTPQGFRAAVLRAAHAQRGDATDDAALVEGHGGRVIVVPGEATNVKITDRGDLDRASNMLAERGAASR